jgi:hypothetical protein
MNTCLVLTDPHSFQGILTLQAFIYYKRFPGDPKYLKILVSAPIHELYLLHVLISTPFCTQVTVIWSVPQNIHIFLATNGTSSRILDATHLVLIAQAVYYYLVSSYADPVALLAISQTIGLHFVFVGLATTCCQGLFLNR